MAKNRTSNEIAAGFADEVFFGLRRQRNVLGFVAAGSITVAMTSVVALCLALPMKEIRPYVVMVDRSTGESEQIVSTRPGSLSDQEAVQEAEIVRYVTDRETYDVADNAERIPMVANTSVGQAAVGVPAAALKDGRGDAGAVGHDSPAVRQDELAVRGHGAAIWHPRP